MIYAKMENGKSVFCPRNGYVDGTPISNLPVYFENNPEVAKKEGWKIFIPCEEVCEETHLIEDENYIYELENTRKELV